MPSRPLINPFQDQSVFMQACDQTVGKYNQEQFNLYLKLIVEEVAELEQSVDDQDRVNTLKELCDVLVVTLGAIHSFGADAEGAWQEVIRSNMSKIDPETGRVLKREDGKVLKPASYSPANLDSFVK
jgi:predicted HAD superfamily Cof-like phosphohydrolase